MNGRVLLPTGMQFARTIYTFRTSFQVAVSIILADDGKKTLLLLFAIASSRASTLPDTATYVVFNDSARRGKREGGEDSSAGTVPGTGTIRYCLASSYKHRGKGCNVQPYRAGRA